MNTIKKQIEEVKTVSKLNAIKIDLINQIDTLTKKQIKEYYTLIDTKINAIKLEKSKIVKVTRKERNKKAIKNAETEGANRLTLLRGAKAETEEEMFSLSKISTIFCKSKFVTDKQRNEILTFVNIKDYVNNDKVLSKKDYFNVNDVTMICNALIKKLDKGVILASKVEKQGGKIVQ